MSHESVRQILDSGVLECIPMRAASRILFDATGYLTTAVKKVQSLNSQATKVYRSEIAYFWIRLLFTKRCLDRGELWRAAFYLNDARKAMLQLIRLRECVYSKTTSTHSPATRLKALIGEKTASEIAPCVARCDRREILQSIRYCAAWLQKQATEFKWYVNGAEDVWHAVASIHATVLK